MGLGRLFSRKKQDAAASPAKPLDRIRAVLSGIIPRGRAVKLTVAKEIERLFVERAKSGVRKKAVTDFKEAQFRIAGKGFISEEDFMNHLVKKYEPPAFLIKGFRYMGSQELEDMISRNSPHIMRIFESPIEGRGIAHFLDKENFDRHEIGRLLEGKGYVYREDNRGDVYWTSAKLMESNPEEPAARVYFVNKLREFIEEIALIKGVVVK